MCFQNLVDLWSILNAFDHAQELEDVTLKTRAVHFFLFLCPFLFQPNINHNNAFLSCGWKHNLNSLLANIHFNWFNIFVVYHSDSFYSSNLYFLVCVFYHLCKALYNFSISALPSACKPANFISLLFVFNGYTNMTIGIPLSIHLTYSLHHI